MANTASVKEFDLTWESIKNWVEGGNATVEIRAHLFEHDLNWYRVLGVRHTKVEGAYFGLYQIETAPGEKRWHGIEIGKEIESRITRLR